MLLTNRGTNMKLSNIKKLVSRSKELWPNSIIMQKNWVRQTVSLTESGRHALLTGGWTYPNNRTRA